MYKTNDNWFMAVYDLIFNHTQALLVNGINYDTQTAKFLIHNKPTNKAELSYYLLLLDNFLSVGNPHYKPFCPVLTMQRAYVYHPDLPPLAYA